jgi:hypothetical protein
MDAVPFGFGEQEDESYEDDAEDAGVEPEEAAPADVFCHGTGDDGTDLDKKSVSSRP